MEYRHTELEARWQAWWEEQRTYKVDIDPLRPKYYVLDMFPYPSGAGLHVGHPLGYIASDIIARYKSMEGYNVLHPMGFDAFGLPAEQYAIQTGVHPAHSTRENIMRYRRQLRKLGFNYDWDREVTTSDPSYYKWTQWIFLQLYHHWYDPSDERARPISELKLHFEEKGTSGLRAVGSDSYHFSSDDWKAMNAHERSEVLMNYRLAYRKTAYVNWCEALGTVLANDEVKDGVSERGGYPVERKPMLQWSLRITAYAERLLLDLDNIAWSDAMKTMQRNWIGRSEGARVRFALEASEMALEVFTTRPDTIFGVSFMVVAPEHELMDMLTTTEQRPVVQDYLDWVKTRSDRERMSEVKQMTGVFTGAYALHPFNGERIPVWTADYVLKDYGTGAIMGVPADDDRDRAFAEKFNQPIREIIDRSNYPDAKREDKVGIMINSGFLDGMEVPDAIKTCIQRLEGEGIGEHVVNYRLRDALFSRQRYWGEPFPISYDKEGVEHALPEEELPLTLPDLENFKPTSDGKSPVARAESWVNAIPGLLRETDTMPGYAGSSWYFLRYMDARNETTFASREALDYWQDVDIYIGGTEHAVGHLMYARFWHKFLFDLGYVPTPEPFRKLVNQGMIQGVIESIFMAKQKEEGRTRFLCASLISDENRAEYTEIPILIDFVRDYGSPDSYLDEDGLEQLIAWRPEFKDAIFECENGTYRDGVFRGNDSNDTSLRLRTHSEVGKMSKSKYNVINPDDVVEQYGADCFRMYEMFLGPVEQSKPWDTKGIDGVSKFLKRWWSQFVGSDGLLLLNEDTPDKSMLRVLHQTIQKVRDDLDRLSLNTCVSHFMICLNELKRMECHHRAIWEPLVRLLAPFAPHICEELWHRMGQVGSVHHARYPIADPALLVAEEVTYPVSINGKKRAELVVPLSTSSPELEERAQALPEIRKWLDGLQVRKIIVVPGRMINIVAG